MVNRNVGNSERAATLECTLTGPQLRFHSDTTIALGGAEMNATLDGAAVPYWETIDVRDRSSIGPDGGMPTSSSRDACRYRLFAPHIGGRFSTIYYTAVGLAT